MVLYIGTDTRMLFDYPAEFGLPITVENDPVDLAFRRRSVRLPSIGLRGVEADMERRPGGVVRIQHGLDGLGASERARDAGDDALTGHVGQRLVFELCRIGAALADQARIQPLSCDTLELTEQVQLGGFTRVAVSGQDQMCREFIEDL